jgi:hypothetical protein
VKEFYRLCKEGSDQYDLPIYSSSTKEVKKEVLKSGKDSPYIETKVTVTGVFKEYNPEYGDDKLCKCGHPYYRHFDPYEGMAPVGCKYCRCNEFVPAED